MTHIIVNLSKLGGVLQMSGIIHTLPDKYQNKFTTCKLVSTRASARDDILHRPVTKQEHCFET